MNKGIYGRILLVAADLERMHGRPFAVAFLEDYFKAKKTGRQANLGQLIDEVNAVTAGTEIKRTRRLER